MMRRIEDAKPGRPYTLRQDSGSSAAGGELTKPRTAAIRQERLLTQAVIAGTASTNTMLQLEIAPPRNPIRFSTVSPAEGARQCRSAQSREQPGRRTTRLND